MRNAGLEAWRLGGLGVVLLMACSGGSGKSGDAGPVDAVEVTQAEVGASDVAGELPSLVTECSACHVLDDLAGVSGGEWLGPGEWVAKKGSGLTWKDPAIPSPGTVYGLEWPERGSHAQEFIAPEKCGLCHPVDENGIGHGIRAYPEPARNMAFVGGESCAGDCHGWLDNPVAVTGFEEWGGFSTFNGYLDPEDLLVGADNAHSELWKIGFVPENMEMKISSFNPGCGGCHNVKSEAHGAIVACTDCHAMASDENIALHGKHVEYIAAHVMMMAGDLADVPACAFCHREDGAPEAVSNAACYNCHLSGHQPLNAGGSPHFWPIH